MKEVRNNGGFDVGGYLVGGLSHETLGGDVLVRCIEKRHPRS